MKKLLSLFLILLFASSMTTVKADYYVAGDPLNGWNAGDANYKMSGSNPHSVTKQLSSGAYKFKITNGSWDWSTNSYDNSASNVTLSIVDGNIAFSLGTTSDVTFYYNATTGKAYVQATPVVVPSYTFPNGTTIYYDFTAYGNGVNVCINGGEPWHGNTSAIFSETLSSAWEVTATTNLFKSAPPANSWSYKTCSTLPTEGQNMLVGDADGIGCHWDTYSGGMPEPEPPTIKMHGDFLGSWNTTDAFAVAGNKETASLTLNITSKGLKYFGMRIGSDDNWTSNGAAITRASASAEIVSGSGNCSLNADVAGNYTFTWTYADNSLSVTYPALPTYTVDFVGLENIYFVNDAVNFNATSTGVDNPTYTYYVKKGDAAYGSAVSSYTFVETGSYTVKVEVRENGAGDALKTEEQTVTIDEPLTLYFVNKDAWEDVNVYFFNPNKSDWPGDAMTATGEATAFHNYAVYSYTVHASVFGSANVIFNNGSGSQTSDLDVETNHYFYNGAWYATLAECDPLPVIKMHGDFLGEWNTTDAFALAGNKETASLSLTIPAKGVKHFGMRIGSDDNWTSNSAAITRASASAEIVAGEGDCSLNADIPGEYTFTWTYANNTLSVTYPDLPAQTVDFDGLATQILKGTELTFAATSTGITNPVYSFYVKPAGGEYGSAVSSYTFDAVGAFTVKVSAEGDNTIDPVVEEENVVVYDTYTFNAGTRIYVDFSAMTEGSKKVNYPNNDAASLAYDEEGAGTFKTIQFANNVTWSTLQDFIKTEKAGWDPGAKFTVPADGQNKIIVAEDGASYTWGTYTPATVQVKFFAPRDESSNWDHVYAHSWDAAGNLTEWPGVEITASKSGDWYAYTAQVGANLLFHNNDGMQTNNIEDIQEAACYESTAINYEVTPKLVTVTANAGCEIAYYISGSKALIGGSADFDTNLPLDANNQIVFEDVVPGTYSFKINNGSWAWAIGGNDHLKEGDCASIAATVGVGDVGFQIDTKQDITITYYPATQEICLGAETIEPIPDIEAIGGKFIINAKGDTAVFSRGNLQYKQTSDKWRCAPKQYDWKGVDNLQMGNPAYPGWVDLFSWSIGAENNYGATSAYNTSLYYNKAFVDWGSKFEGNWSTLSINEWYYLLYNRANANDLWGMAMIGDTLGMVLLPNGWTNPGGVTFVPGTMPTTNMWNTADCLDPTMADKDHWRINKENLPANKFTEEEWAILEAAGAVFCPYGGRRSGGYGNHTNRDNETVSYEYAYAYYENYYGAYWTSTVRNAEEGKVYWLPMICGGCDAVHENWGRGSHGWWENGRYGHSVRLVYIIPRQYTVTYDANGAEGVVPTDAAKYPDGAAITLASAAGLSKEGYVFAGWKFKGVTYNDSYTINNVLANEEIVFEAQWDLMPAVTLRDGLNDGKWGTYCPPRKVLNAEGATFYQISYLEEQAGMPYNMIFDQIEGTTLTAGKPYFFIANASEIRGIQVGDALTAADPNGVNGFYGYIGASSKELDIYNADYEPTGDNTFIIYNNSVFRINQGGTMLRSERCYINISPSEPDRTPVSPAPTRRRVTMNVTGTSATTGMESVQTSEGNIQKVMIDGQLFILRGEKMYDATGRMVK